MWVIDINSRKVVKQIPVGVQPAGVGTSTDGNTLYVANSKTNDLSVIDLLDLEEVRRVRVGNRPFSLDVDSSGRVYVVESGDNTVSVFSPDLEKIGSFPVGKGAIDVDVTRDGRYAFVTAEKANRLFVFEIH